MHLGDSSTSANRRPRDWSECSAGQKWVVVAETDGGGGGAVPYKILPMHFHLI